MPAPRNRTHSRDRAHTRRASHSMESVISEAVALLDEAGQSALTFRALAGRLGGGVASIYWYVDNKDELLDKATDHVLVRVLEETERFTGDSADPIDNLRSIALAVFDAILARPWLAAYFMRNTATQANSLALYERMGAQAMRLGLSPRDTFHAVSAVFGFVLGIAADLVQEPPPEILEGATSREEFLGRVVDDWRALDASEYPFLHYVIEEFAGHDDIEQFKAGLDILLEGLRLQAEG